MSEDKGMVNSAFKFQDDPKMKEGETGVVEKALSVAILVGFLLPFLVIGRMGVFRLLPVMIPPLLLIWFPEKAAQYFGSGVKESSIRNWGWVVLFLFAVPVWIAFWWLR
ncbi:MAG: hypothetical protein ACJAQT_000372 [Akkermansiaceae bacterium]